MKFASIGLLLSLVSTSALAIDQLIVGAAVDPQNTNCEEDDRNAQMRHEALQQLQERIRMRSGICAWHSRYLSVKTEPSFSWADFGSSGCKVTTSVIAECSE